MGLHELRSQSKSLLKGFCISHAGGILFTNLAEKYLNIHAILHDIDVILLLWFCRFQHFYHVLQSLAFVVMAIIIMRLKLFGTPALCVMASLLASRQVTRLSCRLP